MLLAASPELLTDSGLVALTADLRGVRSLELRTTNRTSQLWHYGPAGWGDPLLYPARTAADKP